MAANTYYAFKTGSTLGCVAHSTEATIGGLMSVGFGMSAYAQHIISNRIQGLAASIPHRETATPQAYPNFSTQAPTGSHLIDKVAAGTTVIGLLHPLAELLSLSPQ